MSKVAIIGAGFYGLFIASILEKKYDVTVFERNTEVFKEASFNCQARLHNGLFYIKSLSDLKSCIKNVKPFMFKFKDAIIRDLNSYYIVHKDSNVCSEQYKIIAKENGISLKPVKLDYLNYNNVQECFIAKEYCFNLERVRDILLSSLSKTKIITNSFTRVERLNDKFLVNGEVFDKVVNCSYSEINTLRKQVNLEPYNFDIHKINYYNVLDNLGRNCFAVVDGNFWNSTITENDKRYHCGNIQNESQLEKEVQKIIPEFKIHKIETKICTKCNLRDTRKPIIFNENNFVTVFGGKITNIFELLDKIQKI